MHGLIPKQHVVQDASSGACLATNPVHALVVSCSTAGPTSPCLCRRDQERRERLARAAAYEEADWVRDEEGGSDSDEVGAGVRARGGGGLLHPLRLP